MKLTIWVYITFTVVLKSVIAEPVGKCPNEMRPEEVDFLVDSHDCSVFYKCDWGKQVKYYCPDNLHFNRKLNVCDWPGAAGCHGSPNPLESTTVQGCDNNECGGGSATDGGNGSNGECPNDPCPKENGAFPVYFSHPKICGRFCQCDWGIGYDMPCPDGLHFNTELNVCDWPKAAGCDGSSNHTPTPPGPGCDDDGCSGGTTIDNGNGSNGECPNDPCPKENGAFPVYFAHPKTCGRFCQCDWGIGYDMSCPDGLHFNTELNVCDWPEAAGCDGSSNHTPTPPGAECDDDDCSSGTTVDNGNGSNGECPNDPCPKENGAFPVYFAHPKICGRFCQCDWGIGYDMPCPDGLHFNTELNVCDWPETAGCDGFSKPVSLRLNLS